MALRLADVLPHGSPTHPPSFAVTVASFMAGVRTPMAMHSHPRTPSRVAPSTVTSHTRTQLLDAPLCTYRRSQTSSLPYNPSRSSGAPACSREAHARRSPHIGPAYAPRRRALTSPPPALPRGACQRFALQIPSSALPPRAAQSHTRHLPPRDGCVATKHLTPPRRRRRPAAFLP